MFLMPSHSMDFKYLATKVVDTHIGSGKSLEDCIVEVSEKQDFTPEEIKRLVEKSNTELALRHLRGESKKDNFELARFADVLKRTHGSESNGDEDTKNTSDTEATEAAADSQNTTTNDATGASEKTASIAKHTGSSALPLTRRGSYTGAFFEYGQQKVANTKVVDEASIFALRKQSDEAQMRKVATEIRLQGNLDTLAKVLRSKTPDELGKIAAEAATLYGDTATVAIGSILRQMGKQAAEATPSDVIDDTQPVMRKIAEVCNDLALLDKQTRHAEQYRRVTNASNSAVTTIVDNMW